MPRKYSQLGGKFLARPLLEKFILSGSLVANRSANIATRIKNKYKLIKELYGCDKKWFKGKYLQ